MEFLIHKSLLKVKIDFVKYKFYSERETLCLALLYDFHTIFELDF